MCLYASREKEKTATDDMVVYKTLELDNKSIYKQFKYEKNKTYRLKKKLIKNKNFEINQGFHSFRYCPDESMECHKMVKMIIPKGAKYYIGIYGDIVSTSIRTGDLRRLLPAL